MDEFARRQAICLACEDWDPTAPGCRLIAAFERQRLTEHKQRHGRCARCCTGREMKW